VKQKSWAKNPIDLFILRKLKTVDRDAEATLHSIPKEGTYVSEHRETALPKRPSRN